MAWTDVITWTPKLVTPANMNEQVRDNLNALKAPPTGSYRINEGSNYTTTSSTFVDVDATDLSLDITTTGGDVLIMVNVVVTHSVNANRVYLDVTEDGTRIGGDDGLIVTNIYGAARAAIMSFCYLHTPDVPGTYTYRLQWKTSAATATMYAGAGTASYDVHGSFIVREVS